MQYVTVIQNMENNSMDFIMHGPMDSEELEERVQEEIGIDITNYNWQTYDAEGFMQRHFILK